jgi:hypothetical protein
MEIEGRGVALVRYRDHDGQTQPSLTLSSQGSMLSQSERSLTSDSPSPSTGLWSEYQTSLVYLSTRAGTLKIWEHHRQDIERAFHWDVLKFAY